MPPKTDYLVQAKGAAHWKTLGPFDRREEGERAFEQAVEQDGVSYGRLLAGRHGEDGEITYEVLRVFWLAGSEHKDLTGEVSGSARPIAGPAQPVARGELAAARGELEPRSSSLGHLANLKAAISVVSDKVVHYEPGQFSAWPANSGAQAWQWGDEILIGFFNAVYEEKEGHNWAPPSRLLLARSTNGGENWSSTEANFGGPGPAPGNIDFTHPDFALRIFDETESFFISYDRGRTWPGPYRFGDLLQDSPVAGDEFSSRTDYIANSSNQAFFFMSSRREIIFTEDYTYMAKTDDGGASFDFVSFVDPFDIDRNVMPSTVRVGEAELVTCTRRKDNNSYWVECYRSNDNGASWSSLGQVDGTGDNNGNPPALVRLANGYLVCVYGVRQRQGTSRISAKVSADDGRTWSVEHRLRDDFVGPDAFGDVDLGYPRAFVRPDGKIVSVYYWATASRPEQHIAATIFQLPPQRSVEIGQWVRGLTHEKGLGSNRLLLFTVHYVEKGSRFKDPKSVRYGGQTMTKLLERDQEEKGKQTYIAVFYLKEDDIQKSMGDGFQVNWEPNRPDNWEASSVFLTNVSQADSFGDRDTAATRSGNQLACDTFTSVAAGDAVILAGTVRKRGMFTLHNGFLKADEFNLTRGGVRPDGDGVVGHRSVTETSDQQGLMEHTDPGTMVLACVRVHQLEAIVV